LAAGLLLVVRGVYLNRSNKKALEAISDELLSLYKQTAQTKKLLEKRIAAAGADLSEDIDSPAVLSTMITVLIKKIGSTRLSMDDFVAVGDNDYISVYIDSATNEIILSLDHTLTENDPLKFVNFSKTDDSTYH
tara:strand:- start:681 stop:1082 length:402 start_codon:yes stop_codon:yes gene_type:complete